MIMFADIKDSSPCKMLLYDMITILPQKKQDCINS